MFIPFIIVLAISIILYRSSDTLSRKIDLSGTKDKAASSSSKDIQVIAFSIIGVFVLVQAVPEFFIIITKVFYLKVIQNTGNIGHISYVFIGEFIGAVIKLILGFYLFFQSEGIYLIWQKIQKIKGMSNEQKEKLRS
jgi:hypothetical protein